MRKSTFFPTYLFLVWLIILPGKSVLAQFPEVFINEFQASNEITIQDPDFSNYSDWLELYNSSNVDIDLSGYFLIDNKVGF